MRFEIRYLVNISLGLFVGSVSMLVLAWSLDTEVAEAFSRLKVFIYTALITMLVSALALAGVLTNLDLQRVMQLEARERKADSARAVSPNAISSFMRSAKSGLKYNYKFYGDGQIRDLAENKSPSELALSDTTITVFRDLIENSSDKVLREHLFELLREHQVLTARSENTGWRSNQTPSKEDYRHVAHWAYLIAVSGLVLGYLRGDTEELKNELSKLQIQGALHVNGLLLSPNSFPNYDEHIELYARHYSRRLAN